ncbi:hypothetical protein LCGC14_1698590 [marine sediment metagenome]|uniref:Uncharacterized protein n=1 Tax=marine sediment metagenome TaxID=412755 RepID=A0A0F9I6B0_9ZZZZ
MAEELKFNILAECTKCDGISYIRESDIDSYKHCPYGECDSTKFIFYKKMERK